MVNIKDLNYDLSLEDVTEQYETQLRLLKDVLSLIDLIAIYAEEIPAAVLTIALVLGQEIEQAIAKAEGNEK